jgi:hypothetical protein
MSGMATPIRDALHAGQVIPAHPLALDPNRKLDERRQRALTRYYLAAGAGGKPSVFTPPNLPSATPP